MYDNPTNEKGKKKYDSNVTHIHAIYKYIEQSRLINK